MNSVEFFEKSKNLYKINNICSDEEENLLYGLYYQATLGNNNLKVSTNSRVNNNKIIAWETFKNMAREDAEEKFIINIENLFSKYNIN